MCTMNRGAGTLLTMDSGGACGSGTNIFLASSFCPKNKGDLILENTSVSHKDALSRVAE